MQENQPKKQSKKQRFAKNAKWSALPIAMLASGLAITMASYSAFTAVTASRGNSWHLGNVMLNNDRATMPAFNEEFLVPGDSGTKCITVIADGTAEGHVKMYIGGSDIRNFSNESRNGIQFSIQRGTGNEGDINCENFKPLKGEDEDFIFRGSLAEMVAHNSFDRPFQVKDDPDVWDISEGKERETRTFKIHYQIPTTLTNISQDNRGTVDFTWEARSVADE